MRVFKNTSKRFRQTIEPIRKSMPAGSTDVGPASICLMASAISVAVMLSCVLLLDRSAVLRRYGEGIYSQGSWATSFRFHNGMFYVCFNSNDMQNTYIYRTADQNILTAKKIAADKDETSETTVICVFIDGPAVSLKGSPTVSPTTAAL